MKILVWNIRQGGGRRKPRIQERVKAHDPDMIVLLEFIEKTAGPFLHSLSELGWTNALTTRPNGANHHICVLSKRGIETIPSYVPALDDSGLWIEVGQVSHDLRLGVVHAPTSNRATMRAFFDGLIELAERRKASPFVFVGDFNTGRHPIDGDLLRLGCVDRFEALQEVGFVDVWRYFNGDKTEPSFYWRKNGFRIDHALASAKALERISSCVYSHREREEDTSDHAILVLEIDVPDQVGLIESGGNRA